MKTCIDVLLRFDLQTTDVPVVGFGRMATWIENDLPHIGERIMPCTGQSEISAVFERYEIRVVDVCRNVGGSYVQVFLCEVRFATWSPHSGRPLSDTRASDEVLDDWAYLKGRLENGGEEQFEEGSAIPVLNIIGKTKMV